MFEFLGISLALAALLTFNAIASLLTALLWRAIRRRTVGWKSGSRAQLLFVLRVFPSVISVICVAALLLPAYIVHEPREGAETVSFKLGFLAAISAIGIALAIWRGAAAWVVTRRLIKNWLRHSERIELEQINLPAYRLKHSFPVIALVGAFRPRLFIADQLFDALSPAELQAAIAHECGHLAALDNLKRALLRACRDSLTIAPCGRLLDRAWAEESELAADEYAAQGGGVVALDLAAALIKIARLASHGARPMIPAGALLIGENAGGIAGRVKRLTQLAALDVDSTERTVLSMRTSFWLLFALLTAVALLIAANQNSLSAIHGLIELAVSILQ